MKRIDDVIWMLFLALPLMAGNNAEADTVPMVNGYLNMGTSVDVNGINGEMDEVDLVYARTEDRYQSCLDETYRDVRLAYDALLNVNMKPSHTLTFSLRGTHEWEHTKGTLNEAMFHDDALLSRVHGQLNKLHDGNNDITAGVRYSFRTRRPGESLSIGYQYRWNRNREKTEQHVDESLGWALFTDNVLERQIGRQCHHATVDYRCPITKGHALDMGVIYDRHQWDVHTLAVWDGMSNLDADYCHLTQFGALYARYRMQLEHVQMAVGLEYRATKMQLNWLHDLIPSALLKYQIDSVHSLSVRYGMLLIRPEYFHLDTNRVADAYTQSFGNNALVGTHVHNTSLTYGMALPNVTFSTEVRYIAAQDGITAIWMEKEGVRVYTWGNEGVRHAVGLTPTLDLRLGNTTRLHLGTTILWDKRIADAIHMANANWGVSATAGVEQQLPCAMALIVRGNYAYHNTLDLYSYADHGGNVEAKFKVSFLEKRNLILNVGYACRILPTIHITQGAYAGTQIFSGCAHTVEMNLSYDF